MNANGLISSYDETNDVLVCKLSENNGYIANYAIACGVYLNVNKDNLPVSIFIENASDTLNVSKGILENSNVSLFLRCDKMEIDFELSIADRQVFVARLKNSFNISSLCYGLTLN